MSNQIIGNTEYNSIKEKAYINGTQENLMRLAAELDKSGISYSGRISDYRSAITVEAADRARTLEIMKGILNAAKENVPEDNSEKNIIGNAEYRYISNKRYVRGETEAMLRTADRLTAENISFSGRIKGDTVTLTVSGDEMQELVKRYFAEEKNRIENVQSAYFLALSSDTFEDGYYISEVNATTGEEVAPYRSSFGDISMFVSVDSAVRYAKDTGITLSNTDEQLSEWRRTEAEAEAEKERQLNLSRSREIIKRLPMTSENNYEEHFVLRENSIDWIYFNPDGANGEGQFVQTSLYADDLIAAYNARSSTEDYRKYGQSEFVEIIQNGNQTVINADTEEFERLADTFIKSRSNENVIVSAPIVSGNGYDNNFERNINLLENHFEDVRKYKGNHITEASENISVEGHIGTWYVIAAEEIEGRKLFLLEHEKYGDKAANIIIDENKNLVMADVYNGFDDYRDSLEYDDGKQYVSRDFAVELWENGFTVFMNDRNNVLPPKSDDTNIFELFTDEKNNTFYAFNKDIVQQRLLDDTVTLIDNINSAAQSEAIETEKEFDNIIDYANDVYANGDCTYEWSDGLSEWQNISASIRSGDTEYLYDWLRDIQLELPYLEENRDVSITEALNYLDNYEKQYMNKLLSALDKIVDNAVVTYNKLSSKSIVIPEIPSRLSVISPVGKYVPDENLPLSKQLYELAKRELADYENSLDTAEKAKAAAYELSVKRDILSYIEYDLAEDITDPDVETACRRLISTGYPLDTFYQDWLKNEYDNRMEAIRMTAADFLKEKTNTLEFQFANFEDINMISNSKLLNEFVSHNPNVSFALANAIIGYLDEKQHTEREIEELNVGGLKAVRFTIKANIDGEVFDYEDRFDLGSGKGAGGGTLIDNIKYASENYTIYDSYPNGIRETIDNANRARNILVPFLEKNAVMSPEEEKTFAEFKENNPIITADTVKADKATDSPMGNLEEERHISATDITIGDRFLYKGEEVTVSTLKGIYPDDVGIGKVKRTGLIDFEFIRSVDRFTLVKDGVYLGNAEKAKSEEKTEYTDEPISQKENLSVEDNSPMGTNEAIVHNAFQRLKDNHDFSPEVVKLLERVEKLIIGNDWENFNSKIFEVPLFQQTYGSVSRVNEKLFGGELRSIIDEVNGYIFEEQLPNKELFSESDLSTLREIKAEHDRSNAEEAEKERNLEKAKKLINDFCDREYGSTGDFSDLHNVSLAYTTLTDDELPIQVTADLVDFKITFELNGEKYNEEKYNSLEDLIDYELSNLDFDELVYVPDRVLEKYMSGGKSNELMNDFSEAVEKALKTVTNQYNSFLLVQDVVYSFRDLQDGYADDYDWKNYAEAFKNVLDSNVHTEIALPLYKSEAYEILLAAAERKEISADDIAKALKNLELVLQNSHLLKNPEEKVEQISFFDSTPSRKSSDEIGFYSSTAEVLQSTDENAAPIQANSPVENMSEQQHISAADIKIGDKFLFQGEEVTVSSLEGIYPDDVSLSKFKLNKSNGDKSKVKSNVNKFSLANYGIYLGNSEIEKLENAKKLTSKSADYTITDKNYGTEGGAKARFANNVAAIKLLKDIEKENRTATPKEQEVLAKYVGWGGIANAFDSRKPDWSKEYTELKGLLTDEEYRAARASTMNAHYTSPTVINAIYSTLDNMGFDGGKILEPAMGIGNFFGAMPENIRANSDLHGVELDSITGRIAKQLYPSANIQIKGYEDTSFENGSFDVAVGNVPFGGYKLNDKDYNKQNLFIHDYFFAKTLDKVRAGGIVAFVTSKGTLDKESPEVRKYLAERAELLGAIRLPNNAFKANAGTEVTSDIIFLQKRERPISIEEDTPEWVYKDMLPNGIAVNKYFADHPEMILGEMVEGNKLYGNQTDASMCIPIEGADLEKQLAEAVKNITGEYKAAEKEIEKSPLGNIDEIPCPPNAPEYSFIVQDDILYYHKAADTMEKYNAPEKSIEKIKAMAQLRDTVHSLLDLQLNNTDGRFDTAISEAQAALNKQYDNFSENYGLISNAENKMLFRNDNSYHLIKSLEKLDKDGNFIGKADIFSKITVNPNVVVDHCDNAQDALILSLSEKMCVNLEYMSILTGKSEEEIVSELGDKIFQNPQKNMRWESADEYLTGNIRSKLAAAEAAGLTRNAEALRSVMPERIEAADIAVKLGAAWIDPDYIRQFIIETLKPDFVTSKNIEVTYMPATDKWKVEGWRSAYNNVLATETYGTFDMNAYEIIEATLNMQKAEIRQRVKDERGNDLRDSKGRYVYETDPKRTMIVQAKQDELKRKFSDWIFSDPDRREKLVDVYNEKFNSVRLREYDGSHLNFVGMSSAVTLKEHQKNAVARGLYSNGNTLLAHEVGAGKTFEMIAIAMEGKRLGLHNKSLITAPNGLTEQWGNAFRTLYPNANVLVATEKDFQKENRRDLFAKIATGDWDAVVIGHSQFDMIHLSRERELEVLNIELDRLEEALREMDDGVGRKSFSVKQIEKAIKTYEGKIEKLLAKSPEDDMLCFEKLGIDKIFVDESQAYKNLDTPTKMRNVSGIGSGGSGRSMQLLMKCKYLDELTGGKGCVFASGTPISNSMSEMYTLMRYLQADKLAELGINSFDRWASVFGETTTSMELSPEGNGKYQMKTRFAKFQNLPELMNIFKECADIKTAESLDLDRPDFEMHNVNVPATAIQATMIKELGERAKEIRAGNVDPTDDNMCKLTVDGRKIGLDQRCMNPNLPDDPKSKVNVCINNVFDIWQRTAEEKSTQLIFCDLATPQPTLNENTYTVYRKDTKGGYNDVYSAKLGEKDTAEKIMKKLNGKKPPKNYEAGDVADGDIIMLKRVNYEEETAYNTAFEVVDGKLTEIAPETWEKLHHTPVEQFESERKFCVYDDIKQKLIAKGVPEKEIAFIHDAPKAEDKQKLYDKMNKGEIRVLIGSTFKCGAGMNAQERMIALHDLDAPMRPSDMERAPVKAVS
ncbi:MAG: SNF2-related protein [Oscillospiraceae bacterium]|nr:SNF2-related protein [Oscillospiraceae bacterium]